MKFSVYDLKELDPGQVVEVRLSAPANVRLMNADNFEKYRRGQVHKYLGGRVSTSPYRMLVPRHEHWYVTIDLGGLAGACKHSVQVLGGALPDAPPSASVPGMPDVPSLAASATSALPGFSAPAMRTAPQAQCETTVPHSQAETMGQPTHVCEFDVFVEHAPEDKDAVVVPLARTLGRKGYKVRYKDFVVSPDTNLRKSIGSGLHRGRVGLLVISRSLVRTARSPYEINFLLEKHGAKGMLIPVWHDITKQEIFEYSRLIAGFPSRNTATETIGEIAEEVIRRLQD